VTTLFHDLVSQAAQRWPSATAVKQRTTSCDYAELQSACVRFGSALIELKLARHDRVAVYLPKQLETVFALFGAAQAGCVFVPINPVLKPAQVRHILRDCAVRVLVTSTERLGALREVLSGCPDLQHVVLVGSSQHRESESAIAATSKPEFHNWDTLLAAQNAAKSHRVIDADMAAILYTSGSTGSPKGVVLSHRNLVAGVRSVAQYLNIDNNDRLLAILPLSFDYGLNQLSTAFYTGASVVMLDHLFARDVVAAVAAEDITGLAAVPPLWVQLADVHWPNQARSLRYITNSGGTMPSTTLQKLRALMPRTQVFLMYGLTEAFRSTYLPPDEIDRRPDSIGKAIPNADVLVVRPDGSECAANEPGELVHRGALVAQGYWNAPELTAQRFRPAPGRNRELCIPEVAVWSGDTVRRDPDGYLYFIGRQDEMIKTSGYRVSPTEIEEFILQTEFATEAVPLGIPHPSLGQAIAVLAIPRGTQTEQALLEACRRHLPAFMVPLHLSWRDSLPRNPNGKYDRKQLAAELSSLFEHAP
jgi:acyl-CoA ligase (AMP-forming) (exosortase A-associated)